MNFFKIREHSSRQNHYARLATLFAIIALSFSMVCIAPSANGSPLGTPCEWTIDLPEKGAHTIVYLGNPEAHSNALAVHASLDASGLQLLISLENEESLDCGFSGDLALVQVLDVNSDLLQTYRLVAGGGTVIVVLVDD